MGTFLSHSHTFLLSVSFSPPVWDILGLLSSSQLSWVHSPSSQVSPQFLHYMSQCRRSSFYLLQILLPYTDTFLPTLLLL